MSKLFFASDNAVKAHPEVFRAISKMEKATALPYGGDGLTQEFETQVKNQFGPKAEGFLVFNGTGANVLALSSVLKPYQCVFCPEGAHLNVDECGALERFSGNKIISLPTEEGKLNIQSIKPYLKIKSFPHHVQPGLISISQSTEVGTVYSCEEIRQLAAFAHENQMLLHVDGARFANAAASLNCSLKQLSSDLGIDILSFGGTKNGMIFGDSVIFFDRKYSENFHYMRKQGLHLASKMQYLAAQFLALFENNLWHKNAAHANAMAQRLYLGIKNKIKIIYPVQANAVFAQLSQLQIEKLQMVAEFYIWDFNQGVIRLMTSYQTSESEVEQLISEINSLDL